MDLQELQLAAAEVATIETALGEARRSVAEAETERQRAAVQGPAAHRRKDLLDKASCVFRVLQLHKRASSALS
jgi:hypothetical protein